MPQFSNVSMERLGTCDSRLQTIFLAVVKQFDCSVLEGHRGEVAQAVAYTSGASRLKWPSSRHNSKPSKAIDVTPYPIRWMDKHRFYYFAGHVMAIARSMGTELRWGGDWDQDTRVDDQTFFDLIHFELTD